jgi:hypothetical protein
MTVTKAHLAFVRRHKPGEVLDRWLASKTYDFVGRCRREGLIEIIEEPPHKTWPYSWVGTRLTDAGVALL